MVGGVGMGRFRFKFPLGHEFRWVTLSQSLSNLVYTIARMKLIYKNIGNGPVVL